MNTFGVILSCCCLLFALFELWIRSKMLERRAMGGEVLPMRMSHGSALRLAAIMAAAAWVTMGLVALDHLHRANLQRRNSSEVPGKKTAITESGTWQYSKSNNSHAAVEREHQW